MKALLQRVSECSVKVDDKTVASAGRGLLILLGVQKGDTREAAEYLAKKACNLRIFEDNAGKMNLSVMDIKGQMVVVSQFTLAGDTGRGNRPGFETAEKPETAKTMYEYFIECLQKLGADVQTGIFQADMQVGLINDGPVTFMLEK